MDCIVYSQNTADTGYTAGMILGLRLANDKRRYFVTPFLIGWAQS